MSTLELILEKCKKLQWDEAEFFADAFYRHEKSNEEAIFSLAYVCCVRQKYAFVVHLLLPRCPSARCQFLLAQSYLEMGRNGDAKRVILGALIREDFFSFFDTSCWEVLKRRISINGSQVPTWIEEVNTSSFPGNVKPLRAARRKRAKLERTGIDFNEEISSIKNMSLLSNVSTGDKNEKTLLFRAISGYHYYERGQYSESAKYYQSVLDENPYFDQFVEYYPIVLWHLKEESNLLEISKIWKDVNYLKFHSWIAMGNYFSLKGEKDSALKAFGRASDLKPLSELPHLLCAFELLAVEDFNGATEYFDLALNLEPASAKARYLSCCPRIYHLGLV